MKSIKSFVEENEHLFDEMQMECTEKYVSLSIPKTNSKIILNDIDLKHLESGELITESKKFKYYKHYGFKFEAYGEYFLGTTAKTDCFNGAGIGFGRRPFTQRKVQNR